MSVCVFVWRQISVARQAGTRPAPAVQWSTNSCLVIMCTLNVQFCSACVWRQISVARQAGTRPAPAVQWSTNSCLVIMCTLNVQFCSAWPKLVITNPTQKLEKLFRKIVQSCNTWQLRNYGSHWVDIESQFVLNPGEPFFYFITNHLRVWLHLAIFNFQMKV